MSKIECCARLHLSTVLQALADSNLQALHVAAQEEGEILCFTPTMLHRVRTLCEQNANQSFSLLQGRDGSLYVMLDGKDYGRRLWSMDDLEPAVRQVGP